MDSKVVLKNVLLKTVTCYQYLYKSICYYQSVCFRLVILNHVNAQTQYLYWIHFFLLTSLPKKLLDGEIRFPLILHLNAAIYGAKKYYAGHDHVKLYYYTRECVQYHNRKSSTKYVSIIMSYFNPIKGDIHKKHCT